MGSTTELKPLLVRASAGTGKTYRLAGRLLSILVGGAEVETILATTFTRKAAGEILQRILIALATAADDPQDLDDLKKQTGREDLTADGCRRLLHRLMRDIHKLKVCTLDSFFSQLARTFPFELRLPTGWRLSDEIEEVWMRRLAIDRMLASIDANQLATLVSMLGKGDAIRSLDFELQSIIGDGYGDARWCDIDAWETLVVPKGPEDSEITFAAGMLESASIGHKSANQNLAKMGGDLAARRVENLWTSTLLQNVANTSSNEPVTYYKKPIEGELLDAVRLVIAFVKTHVLGLLREQTSATGTILLTYSKHLESLKQQTRVMGFDDVAFRLSKWISEIDPGSLASRLDGGIQHLLLDEFQDTAPVQWSVLKPFAVRAAKEVDETTGSRCSFFCVGDIKQAIYGWRGGRAAIFDAVAQQIAGVQQDTQDLSYRSSPVISTFVTDVFQHLTQHPKFAESPGKPQTKEDFEAEAVRIFEAAFPIHLSAKQELPGYVRFSTTPLEQADDEQSNPGDTSSNFDVPSPMQFIATEIRRLELEAPDRTIGVLTRRNQTVAELIFYLKALGADVSQEGGNPLTDSAAVELVLSALMLSEHPGDLRWAYHISHSPLGKLLSLDPIEPSIKDLNIQVESAANRVRKVVEHLGLLNSLIWLSDGLIPVCSSTDAARLKQLLGLAQVYEQNPQARLSSFVDYVRLKRVERPRPAKVRVMTIHQSKGLEFDSVVLPEMDGQLVRNSKKIITKSASPIDPPEAMLRYLRANNWSMLPEVWRQAFGEAAASAMTEALCLLYVAITRPRHALHIYTAPVKKKDFNTSTSASLIYHALGCPGDPTLGTNVLYENGVADWYKR